MKASCFAIVNSKNDIVWVRPGATPVDAAIAATALAGLTVPGPDDTLYLVSRRSDEGGTEPFVEVVAPWANACLAAKNVFLPAPAKAVVEVWHAKVPTFGMNGLPVKVQTSEFEKCASMWLAYIEGEDERMLDQVYAASQNIDSNWRPGKSCRSSSVGDVFVLNAPEGRKAYAVSSIGFKLVTFDEAAPVEADSALSLSKYRAEAYLKRLGSTEKIGDLYDDDEMLQGALLALIPDFEYPDWSYRTVGDVLKHVFPKP